LASGHVTYTWGKEMTPDKYDIPLTRIPPLFGQLSFRYKDLKIKKWRSFVEIYLRAAARQNRLSEEDIDDIRIPPGGTPGWWTLNMRAGVNLLNSLRFNLIVENIFNKKYKYHASGIYSAGFNAIINLEFYWN